MIVIGQTLEVYKDAKYPSIRDLINKPIKDKARIINYMKKCKVGAIAPAIITDIIDKETIIPELYMMNDGIYTWRSDVIYYVEKYDMELPEDFIQHVLSQL